MPSPLKLCINILFIFLQQVTTLVKSQAAGSGSATSSQSVTIPVQMQNVQGIKTLRTSQNQGQPSMVHLRHQLVQGGPRSKIIPQGGQTILATSQQGQKVALSQVAAGTKGKPYFTFNLINIFTGTYHHTDHGLLNRWTDIFILPRPY